MKTVIGHSDGEPVTEDIGSRFAIVVDILCGIVGAFALAVLVVVALFHDGAHNPSFSDIAEFVLGGIRL